MDIKSLFFLLTLFVPLISGCAGNISEVVIFESTGQAKLAWTDNSTDELGFKIERKTGPGGTYNEIATVGRNVTSYTDIGLSPSTTYYYRVRAYNSAGHSACANEVSFRTSAK